MTGKQPTAAFYTLGCKVNQGETDSIAGMFKARGYQRVDFDEPADVYVINTCTVTHLSDRKSRQTIRRALRLNPDAVVAVTGCYAQTSPDEVRAIEGVDVIVGTDQRSRIVELVEEHRVAGKAVDQVGDIRAVQVFEELPAVAEISRARASIKIEDGCNLFCTYCIIPYARGPVRSRPVESVIREARRLVSEGYQEIVLTGIHLGAYGADLNRELADLLEQLIQEVPELPRLHVGSVEPQEFTEDLLRIIQQPKVNPHFHIPLQSGSDSVLERMGRRYRRQDFMDVVAKIRSLIPDAAITSDVIVGFPGETEADYLLTEETCKATALAGLHVFPFSPRKGTPAASFTDQLPASVKQDRVKRLMAVAQELSRAYAETFVGKTITVLLEEKSGEYWSGHTNNYLKVLIPFQTGEHKALSSLDDADARDQLVPVRLERLLPDNTLLGQPLESQQRG
ncbi:tRNA (N(6)-L-threonylcarbamoyladenosine(37)-C(2))-methylthiotransferase MtaB [Heliobacillus mobilis]|uniref:Threonylcarbamoyladenosine tRNA methylthiotransferase MtaB n=1 Tax=Heliobacterium mobile TaxID=28064 RepID=A0A6I3SMD0_HELMO|nr:tRNA (N(6)-L-threonylcarbamoyladenosine(37)-C(2))-methylthiotransferase MtaB [Heliobacterium mobile]MTV50141.1 tRNA (N(6)-L-threonylcarbamoyladenosine(37)-C(2))-methylthiotransferase MtaB [Heliobacterium mobile]